MVIVGHHLSDDLHLKAVRRLQCSQRPIRFKLGAVVGRHFDDHAVGLQIEELTALRRGFGLRLGYAAGVTSNPDLKVDVRRAREITIARLRSG
jgi:hypothetical protein